MGMGELVDSALVAAAGERRGEEGVQAGLGHFDADQPAAQRDDVGVVMLAGQAGRERLGDQSAAAGGMTVGGDRNAYPRAAQSDSAVGAAGRDLLGELVAVIGIVDGI